MSKCEKKCKDCINCDLCLNIDRLVLFDKNQPAHCKFFKDKSLFVELPVKLGQILYKPCNFMNEVDTCRVSSLTQKADGSWKIRLTHSLYKGVFEITPNEIGKTVFLTKEEAERKLEELGV